MDSSADEWHVVHPQGLGKGLFILTVFFTIFTVIIFGMRLYIRTKHQLNSIEDYLMYIGIVSSAERLPLHGANSNPL